MRVKKVFVTMVVVLSMVAVFAVAAHAGGWYTCTVKMAGPAWGRTYVMLSATDDTFTNRWFKTSYTRQKEMLATALTAITNNMNVSVYLDSVDPYSTIYAMYLISP